MANTRLLTQAAFGVLIAMVVAIKRYAAININGNNGNNFIRYLFSLSWPTDLFRNIKIVAVDVAIPMLSKNIV